MVELTDAVIGELKSSKAFLIVCHSKNDEDVVLAKGSTIDILGMAEIGKQYSAQKFGLQRVAFDG